MQLLRTDYSGKGLWAPIAEALNRIGRVVNDMRGENGINVYEVGGMMRISGTGENIRVASLPFAVTVRSGKVFMRGGPATAAFCGSVHAAGLVASETNGWDLGSGGIVALQYEHRNPFGGVVRPGCFALGAQFLPGATDLAGADDYRFTYVPIAKVTVLDGAASVEQYAIGAIQIVDAARGSVMLWPVEVLEPPPFWVPMDGRTVDGRTAPDWRWRHPIQSAAQGASPYLNPAIGHGEKGGMYGWTQYLPDHTHLLSTDGGDLVAAGLYSRIPTAASASSGTVHIPAYSGGLRFPKFSHDGASDYIQDTRSPYVGAHFVIRW